jgi:hypothetical protein
VVRPVVVAPGMQQGSLASFMGSALGNIKTATV